MKAQIHPKWFEEAKVTCACGNAFTIGATVPEIQVEVCSVCHPFYTGQMKYLDTAGRVDAFRAKMEKASKSTTVSKIERRRLKREKRIEEDIARPDSLSDLRKTFSKKKRKSS